MSAIQMTVPAGNAATRLDVVAIRDQFPILSRNVNEKPLVYLDSAATTQKPRKVIDTLVKYYTQHNANVHRGVHRLSMEATELYEESRGKVQAMINAPEVGQIIFTRGATEAINLVAQSWGRSNLTAGDEVLLSQMEHHSNIVPWQMACEATGAKVRVLPVTDSGEIEMSALPSLLSERTRIVGVVHSSNTLGTVNPIREIVEAAHKHGAKVLVDGAQALQHMQVDVQALDCDFYISSSHKMFGPTGVGFMYGKRELLDQMPPWHGGGDMIRSVSFEKTLYADLPNKFEAGTPNIGGIVAFGAAVDFLQNLDHQAVHDHEQVILTKATAALMSIPGVTIIGTAHHKSPVISFTVEGIHPHDIGTILDTHGVAVRTGHHCTQPLMERFGVVATARASFALYNTIDEVDALAEALQEAIRVFR